MIKHTIAAMTSKVNKNLPQKLERSEKLGKITTAPIQPADRFVNNPDKTLSFADVKNFRTKNIIYDLKITIKSSPKRTQECSFCVA